MTPHLIKMPNEAGYPEGGYATRDKPTEAGRVRVLCTDAKGDLPVVALVDSKCYLFSDDGRYYTSESRIESPIDLIPLQPAAPAKWRQCWAAWYAGRGDGAWGRFWSTKDAAACVSGTGATQVHLIETAAVDGLVEALEWVAKNPYAHRDVLGDIATNALRVYRERL